MEGREGGRGLMYEDGIKKSSENNGILERSKLAVEAE